MLELLNHLFAGVCGQNPSHTWAPGGVPLPFCERCTGMYVGASVAWLLHFWLRPKPTAWFLQIHGAFVLLMAPCGFYWIPQGPVLRTLSGMLFAFAVVAFLWLPVRDAMERRAAGCSRVTVPKGPPGQRAYAAGLTTTLVFVPLLATYGGKPAVYALCGLASFGALALGALVLANAILGLRGIFRLVRGGVTHLQISSRRQRLRLKADERSRSVNCSTG
jgi:uncharacterized membrane protein